MNIETIFKKYNTFITAYFFGKVNREKQLKITQI
jgi:hypothetical protein